MAYLSRNILEDVTYYIVQHMFCQKLQFVEIICNKYTCNLRNVCYIEPFNSTSDIQVLS